ncbi:MAG TPA: hypothetical protein VJ891_16385 [Casimicrobiaceae bacterium]|nr:hypothetical protein [Casimicrobiaceae bacterium]
MSIYGGRRRWSDLNDVVQPIPRPRMAEPPLPSVQTRTTDWSSVRKARPADHLLPLSEKWFDALPPEVAPCALASQFPRIVNLIAAQWNDHQNTPELFADLLGDRRGGRAGFPPAVRRDLMNLQEFWYSGKVSVR